MTREEKVEYLGDGLYVSWDGYAIWLRAPREDRDHEVALEPEVWEKLVLFVEGLRKKDKS